jgi:hypothetical protein
MLEERKTGGLGLRKAAEGDEASEETHFEGVTE